MTNGQEPLDNAGSPVAGENAGQVAVGRFVLQLGDPSGAVVLEASRPERSSIHPRPAPVLVRPRLIRRMLDRRMEVAAALSALDAGLPIEVSGEPGTGKTAILRHLAHHPRASSCADGIIYVRARHQPLADLLQLIFEAFYESDEITKPTDLEIRQGLHDKRALILLDDVQLQQHELEQVLDLAPQSAFAVATRERCLWGEVRSLALKGLSLDDAVLLLERELERSLDAAERTAAVSLCAALGGHPVRILQAAALIRDDARPIEECARSLRPATLIAELMSTTDERQRRALVALTALPGVPLTAQHVSGIAELPDIEPALRALVHRGLVGGSQSRHRLAHGVADQLRRTEDLKPCVNRAITYFTAWAERYRRSPDRLLEEAEALMAAQQYAADARRWGEELRIGRLLEGALAIGARWGAWGICLDRCLAAARTLGDRSAEAWALHQIGSRAVCVGDPGMARMLLAKAAAVRDSIGDTEGAAVSRQNLSLVLAPPVVEEIPATMEYSEVPHIEAMTFRGDTWSGVHTPPTSGVGSTLLTAMLMVLAAGLAFFATLAALSWDSLDTARVASWLRGDVEAPQATGAVSPTPPPESAGLHAPPSPAVRDVAAPSTRQIAAPPTRQIAAPPTRQIAAPSTRQIAAAPPTREIAIPDRASILIFTPRPGSIASDGPTRLCYAVTGALQARVEPGVGDVPPSSTLTCLRVTPERTTTYELEARGRDGYVARQQLVIVR